MNAVKALELIKSRRSTRKYLDRPVEPEKIGQILEAGRYAPSGGNSQTTHFLVISNKEILRELAALVMQEFSKMEVTENMYASIANSIRASKGGKYIFHYNAPILILVANRRDYGNNMADSSCALENMMIMANALDLGSCWINQVHWLTDNPVICEYLSGLGLSGEECVCGGLAVGYPDTEDGLPVRSPLPRKGNPVTYISE